MTRTADGSGPLGAIGPVERPGPLRHRVEDLLRELVVAGELAPGEHLVESEVSSRLGVSRGPVREAFQALQAQGWVDLRPGRGAFVHAPSVAEVDELFAVRAALEGEAAALAAGHAGPDAVAELRGCAARGRAAVAAGDDDEVVALNSALHRRVAELAGNALLGRLIASLDGRVRWYLKPVVRARGLSSWDEHDALVDALAAGDGPLAARLMRAHVERTRRANTGRLSRSSRTTSSSG